MFKVKYRSHNTEERLKARFFSKGYNQQEKINFFETFLFIVKQRTIRTVLSLVVIKKWHIHEMDVRNAFSNDILQETVCISASLGCKNAIHPSFVCKLDKAMYDLKQYLVQSI